MSIDLMEWVVRAVALAALVAAFAYLLRALRAMREDDLDTRETDLMLREESLERSLHELQRRLSVREAVDREAARLLRRDREDARASWERP